MGELVFYALWQQLLAAAYDFQIGAAFGATIIVFQWGYGDGLLGVGKEGPIEAWGPMFIFAIVFGLSMDYEVFLLTRVREEYDRNGGNNGSAVADGLAATGRVISAAAMIMVCVSTWQPSAVSSTTAVWLTTSSQCSPDTVMGPVSS